MSQAIPHPHNATEAQIRADVGAYQRMHLRGVAFAVAYQAWERATFPGRVLSSAITYTFAYVTAEHIALVSDWGGDSELLHLPLAYLWHTDWPDREAQRLAAVIARWQHAQRAQAIRDARTTEARDRTEYDRLRQKYESVS